MFTQLKLYLIIFFYNIWLGQIYVECSPSPHPTTQPLPSFRNTKYSWQVVILSWSRVLHQLTASPQNVHFMAENSDADCITSATKWGTAFWVEKLRYSLWCRSPLLLESLSNIQGVPKSRPCKLVVSLPIYSEPRPVPGGPHPQVKRHVWIWEEAEFSGFWWKSLSIINLSPFIPLTLN